MLGAMTTVLPDPKSEFGARVRERIETEHVIWFTTVGADGTPQPNPVWFLWQDDGLLVFNRAGAKRLAHIEARPQVSLHFNGNDQGGDIVVLSGTARRLEGHPRPHEVPEYVAKYGDAMAGISGDTETFGAAYPVAVRIDVARVRGF
jgi:PPOX class probable F420-dependent enzyme